MRFFLIFLTLLSPFLLRSNAMEGEEKIYIEPTQIGFSQEKIFVELEQGWVEVNTIESDSQGLFIIPPYYSPCGWKCKLCNTCNEFWRFICKKQDCLGIRPSPKPVRPTYPPKLPPQKEAPKE